MILLLSKSSVKDGRIWLPEKKGCCGGYFPVANPEILTHLPTHHIVSGWRTGTVKLKRE